VLTLQQALNLGDSRLDELVEDSIFGAKTHGRVCEFQGKNQLVQDGIAGPNTHASLEELYKLFAKLVDQITPPAITEARDRIVSLARVSLQVFGWPQHGLDPPDGSARIAGRYCVDKVTRARQGGLSLAMIFQVAGHPNAPKCMTLTKEAEDMYHRNGIWKDRKHTPQERNNIDIASWCGIFSLYVYKTAGLKMSNWPLRIQGLVTGKPEYKQVFPAKLERGDIGIIEPNGRNHHFVITEKNGNSLASIDGNAGLHQTIVPKNEYTLGGPNNDQLRSYTLFSSHGTERVVFIAPIWKNVGVKIA
jgi:hypothetical protein